MVSVETCHSIHVRLMSFQKKKKTIKLRTVHPSRKGLKKRKKTIPLPNHIPLGKLLPKCCLAAQTDKCQRQREVRAKQKVFTSARMTPEPAKQ
ncbi:hypothetical protein CDAR_56331 [Caerostris darwini]|uniref:Uncharacterized protein n=1 Tax=Caerostris darwini TaxID=1538125 RepID=A0AAV4WMX7_9ARAC|nr:hypothetical protein CDAR_56331 [Caerostris darwini]